ncbi:dihydrodipicolinate synthase family protein [Dietzia massiliensis]|uniref:dihydrodipicolinate synthase family protein n=1 Tax=Dietzia massiliensis TaxID=2697499 RepID=UPI002810D2BB|nr:dihydrodipicolinate synthase family protein [Dietzia massiliensis]
MTADRAGAASAAVTTGLSAFPLTPLRDDRVDERAYAGLVERLVRSGVDTVGALGSTGSYAYLDRAERRRVAELTVQSAGDVPVIVGISALRTSHVRALAHDAQAAGASAVMLAPMSYQPLTADDVVGLYTDVATELSVPMVVYDNPGTTRFDFAPELYARLAELPAVASVKIPPPPPDAEAAREHIARLRTAVPARVGLGVSGDPSAAAALLGGCACWYSVLAGTLPDPTLEIARAALAGNSGEALAASDRLAPLWDLFARHGSLRVVAAVAELLGLAPDDCLPRPLLGLRGGDRAEVETVLTALSLTK